MKNAMKVRESDIQKSIIAYLLTMGWYVIRVNSGAVKVQKGYMVRMAPAGTPDILACAPTGRFVGIEVKVPGNVPTPLQKEALKSIIDKGGVGMWVSSLEETIKDLKSINLLK